MTKEEIDIINSVMPLVKKSVWIRKEIDYRDVMQDLFLKILRNYKKFSFLPDEEKLRYVKRACKNILVDKWRSRNRRYKIAVLTSIFIHHKEDDESDGTSNYLRTLPSVESMMDLKDVLLLLKNNNKGSELLMNLDGYMYREIADFTGLKIDTILARTRYARQFLIKNYVEENEKNKKTHTNS